MRQPDAPWASQYRDTLSGAVRKYCLHGWVSLVQHRDAVETEPAVVGGGVRACGAYACPCACCHIMEGEPRPVGRGQAFARADRRVVAITIEERTIGRHVVEHPVEDDPHAELLRVLDQVLPILLRSEVWVDPGVVLRVIAMVGAGIEHGVEVDRVHTHRPEIIQRLVDAFQVAGQDSPVRAGIPWWDYRAAVCCRSARGSWWRRRHSCDNSLPARCPTVAPAPDHRSGVRRSWRRRSCGRCESGRGRSGRSRRSGPTRAS